jgi:ribosomal protein S12 methylthiotransferase
MNRRGDKAYLTSLFKKIKTKIPNAVLRTTVMVGFPGETKQDFDNLLKFIEEVKFDHLGGFTYSKEEGTKSYDFPHQVRQATKQKRLDDLMALQQKISYDLNKRHIGEIMNGLVVGKENGYYLLRSYWNAPDDVDGKILFSSKEELNEGDIVNVKIKEGYVYDLYGEIVK